MNLELLSKLYEQSHKTVPHKPISGFDARWEDRVFVPEVFAELIVLECIQNIRDNMEVAKVDTLGDKDLFLETLRTSGHFYITELEQHFGVAK